MSQAEPIYLDEICDPKPTAAEQEKRFRQYREMVKSGQLDKVGEMLITAMAGSSWVMLPKPFLRALPGRTSEAIIYATLIDLSKQFSVRISRQEDKGWFFCTTKKLEWETGLNRQQQARAMKFLTNHRLIVTERRGMPPRRWIKVNPIALAALMFCGKVKRP